MNVQYVYYLKNWSRLMADQPSIAMHLVSAGGEYNYTSTSYKYV